MLPQQRSADVSPRVVELRHHNEVQNVIRTAPARFPVEKGKKIDLLNEIQEPWHIHQSKQCHGNCFDPGGGCCGRRIAAHKGPKTKTIRKLVSKSFHARGACPQMPSLPEKWQECPKHQHHAAKDSPSSGNKPAFALERHVVKLKSAPMAASATMIAIKNVVRERLIARKTWPSAPTLQSTIELKQPSKENAPPYSAAD